MAIVPSEKFSRRRRFTCSFLRDTLQKNTVMPAKAGIPFGLVMFTPRPLSSALNQIAREAIGKDWALYATLLDHWREIVGEEYAKKASPVRISFPKGKKTDEKWAARGRTGGLLTIKLPQGLAMEFSFLSETLKTRINGFFGYPMIEKIAFETYYRPETTELKQESPPLADTTRFALTDSIKHIENNELKEALQELGGSILSDRGKE